MSECPLTAKEIREIITRLEALEKWVSDREPSSSASQEKGKGFRKGGVADRGRAASQSIPVSPFPAIPPIAAGWRLVKEAGQSFRSVYGPVPYRGLEDGPGPLPDWVRDQSDFVSQDSRAAEKRISLAFSAGFWARIAIETNTDNLHPLVISEPATHIVVLRASGLGGYVRFSSWGDFEAFREKVPETELVAHGFATETELSIFCFSTRIAVPALFTRC